MNEIRVHIMQCGTIHPPKTNSLFSPWLNLPCWCFLIEHPKGNILIDTGLSYEVLPTKLANYYMIELPEEQKITNQLKKRGFKVEDVDYVFLSDLHPDKTLGLKSLVGAKHILISEEEYYWQCRHHFEREEPSSLFINTPFETYYYHGSPIGPRGKINDFFNDQSFIIVLTDGHTFGNNSFILQNNGNKILFSCDVTLENRTFTPWTVYHKEHSKLSVKWVEETSRTVGCIASLSSHDTEEFERIIII